MASTIGFIMIAIEAIVALVFTVVELTMKRDIRDIKEADSSMSDSSFVIHNASNHGFALR